MLTALGKHGKKENMQTPQMSSLDLKHRTFLLWHNSVKHLLHGERPHVFVFMQKNVKQELCWTNHRRTWCNHDAFVFFYQFREQAVLCIDRCTVSTAKVFCPQSLTKTAQRYKLLTQTASVRANMHAFLFLAQSCDFPAQLQSFDYEVSCRKQAVPLQSWHRKINTKK